MSCLPFQRAMETCGLCLQKKPLRESHLLPRSVYSVIRNLYGSNSGIISASSIDGNAILTDKHVTSKFLCHECEQMLNRNGENAVMKEYKRSPQKFRLLDILEHHRHRTIHEGQYWYHASDLIDIDCESYLYFASSVFWKASSRKWGRMADIYHHALGRQYSEQFRQYLMGHSKFPKNACLAVYVNSKRGPQDFAQFPSFEKREGYHVHSFQIPGIKFVMVVGQKAITHSAIYHDNAIAFVKKPFEYLKENNKLVEDFRTGKIVARGKLAKNMIELGAK